MDTRGRGFALIVVLVATTIVFSLAMQGSVGVRSRVVEVIARRDQAAFLRGADSAARVALAGLVSLRGADARADGAGGGSEASAPSEEPAEEPDPEDLDLPEMPPQIKELVGDMMRSAEQEDAVDVSTGFAERQARAQRQADNLIRSRGLPARSVRVEIDDRPFEVEIIDRGGLLNPNVADEQTLRRYFIGKGVDGARAARLAAEIADWRDEDDFVRPSGAERESYWRAGIAIRNGPFVSLSELLYLPSMTPDLLRAVRFDLTVVSEGTIHAGTAPEAVLLSLPGVDRAIVDQIVSLRRSGELTEAALDELFSPIEDEARELLKVKPSAFVSVRVRDPESSMTAVGHGVVDESGLGALSMRLSGGELEE